MTWFNVEQNSTYPGQLSSFFMSHSTFCVVRSSLVAFLVRFGACRNDDWCTGLHVFLDGLTSVAVEQPCPVEVSLVPLNVVIVGWPSLSESTNVDCNCKITYLSTTQPITVDH